MQFYYKDADGNEVGPVEQAVIEDFIARNLINGATPLRNALFSKYKPAADYPSLSEALGGAPEPEAPDPAESFAERFGKHKVESSAYVHRHTPKDASIGSRLSALIFDLLALGVLAILVFGPLIYLARRDAATIAAPPSAVSAGSEKAAAAPAAEAVAREAAPAETSVAAPAVRSGDAAQNAARKLLPSLRRVEQLNAERNRTLEKAATGKDPARTRERTRRPSASQPAAAAAAAESADVEKADDGEVMGKGLRMSREVSVAELEERARKVVGEVPELSLDKVYAAAGVIVMESPDGSCVLIDQAKFRRSLWLGTLIFVPLVLLYYGLTLGIFAQSFGMWFWGIFLCRREDEEEVYLLRAFIYTVLMLVFGVLMIPAVLLSRRSVADWLCGVRQINVYGATRS